MIIPAYSRAQSRKFVKTNWNRQNHEISVKAIFMTLGAVTKLQFELIWKQSAVGIQAQGNVTFSFIQVIYKKSCIIR